MRYLLLLLMFVYVRMDAREIESVIFDCGGVLVEPNRNSVVEFVQRTFSLNREEADEALKGRKKAIASGLNEVEYWREFCKSNGKEFPDHWELLWDQALWDALIEVPSMMHFVRELKKEGYVVGMLSNIEKEQVELIKKLNIYPAFNPLLLSCEMGVDKPDLKAYQMLLESLKLPAEKVLFIDDKIENVEAARKLGIKAYVFEKRLDQFLSAISEDHSLSHVRDVGLRIVLQDAAKP